MTPLKAVRQHCFNCSGTFKAIKNCPSMDCPLYMYRFGHNPALKGRRGKGKPQALIDWRLKKAKPLMALEITKSGI